MNDSKKFSLGGFPPIYEIISAIKKKEKAPLSIIPLKSILNKRNNLNVNSSESLKDKTNI